MTEERKKKRGEPAIEDNSLTLWVWAGMTFEKFERLPTRNRIWWLDRWRARCEAIWRRNGRPVPVSHFLPETLDDALFRLGMDHFGGLLDSDPLGLSGPRHVEDHTQPDTREWDVIAAEAGFRARERMDEIIEKNRAGRR